MKENKLFSRLNIMVGCCFRFNQIAEVRAMILDIEIVANATYFLMEAINCNYINNIFDRVWHLMCRYEMMIMMSTDHGVSKDQQVGSSRSKRHQTIDII